MIYFSGVPRNNNSLNVAFLFIFFVVFYILLIYFYSLFFGDYLKGKKAGKLYDEVTDIEALQTVIPFVLTVYKNMNLVHNS